VGTESNPLAEVIVHAWTDEDFRRQLLDDPAAVLTAAGVAVPRGVEIRVLEDTDIVRHIVLPVAPDDVELDEEWLQGVVGGFGPDHFFKNQSLP
jgi:hypothetical protein